jgi:monoamine oxidase
MGRSGGLSQGTVYGIWKRLTHHLAPLIQAYRLSEQRWDRAVAKALGSLSVADWMKGTSLPGELRDMLVGLRGFFLADPADLSLISLIDQVDPAVLGGEACTGSKVETISCPRRLIRSCATACCFGMKRWQHPNPRPQFTCASVLAIMNRGFDPIISSSRCQPRGSGCLISIQPCLVSRLQPSRHYPMDRLPKRCCNSIADSGRNGIGRWLMGRNLPIGAVWDANEQQKGKPGILCLMAGGTVSGVTRKLLSTAGAAGLVQALDWIGKRHKKLVAMHSVTWEQNPWFEGGYAVFGPGYDPTLRSWLARPCGRILFAGEHTSL